MLETALREVLAAARRKNLPDTTALPRVLVSLNIKLSHVLDLTSGSVRQHIRVSKKQMIEEAWWKENYFDRESTTQALGRATTEAGFEGIIVPSAADQPNGINFVVFSENLRANSAVQLESPINWKP